MQVFAGVSGREIVQRALQDKLAGIVSGMMTEILNVKDILDGVRVTLFTVNIRITGPIGGNGLCNCARYIG